MEDGEKTDSLKYEVASTRVELQRKASLPVYETIHSQPNRVIKLPLTTARPRTLGKNNQRWMIGLSIAFILNFLLSICVLAIAASALKKNGFAETVSMPTSPSIDPLMFNLPEACHSAVNLTELWRRDHNGLEITPINGLPNCDTGTLHAQGNPWFRFAGDAGSRLLDTCPQTNGSCGTHGALWSNETMPVVVGLEREIGVFGSWTNGCRHFTVNITVMLCSTHSPYDYIYKYDGLAECPLGFCGMV